MRNFVGILTVLAVVVTAMPAWSKQKPRVMVSIKPIHSLVVGLMEGVATPELVVGGKNTPLDYALTTGQHKQLGDSDLVIWMGPELERFLTEPLKALQGKTAVMEMLANDNFKVLNSRRNVEERDPFLWLDVRNAEVFVDELYNVIVSVDPDNAETYKKNRERVKRQVSRLDREFEYGFRAIAGGYGWSYHDVQQYFEHSYALRINGFLSKEPGGAADMVRLLNTRSAIIDSGKTCLFTEAGLTREKLSFLVDGTQAVISELDSFAVNFTPGPSLYEEMMRFNYQVIRDCFEKVRTD